MAFEDNGFYDTGIVVFFVSWTMLLHWNVYHFRTCIFQNDEDKTVPDFIKSLKRRKK